MTENNSQLQVQQEDSRNGKQSFKGNQHVSKSPANGKSSNDLSSNTQEVDTPDSGNYNANNATEKEVLLTTPQTKESRSVPIEK